MRLRGYDYGQVGAYFVTLCTHDREALFGEIVGHEMQLNEAGEAAQRCWREIPVHFPHVTLDEHVVMPNHVHGVVVFDDSTPGAKDFSPLPAGPRPRGTARTLGSVVRGFKVGVTRWMRQHTERREVWQRGFYEHIIRDDAALDRIRRYIVENPGRWAEDPENPAFVKR